MMTIEGFSKYYITESGSVIGPRGHALATGVTSDGYHLIPLYDDDGNQKTFSLHRLVALTFIPNDEGKEQVNHINGDKSDNRVENLEWCTKAENMRHAVDNGLIPTKMTNSGKQMAKELNDAGMTQRLISKLFGVSPSYINQVIKGRVVTYV